MMSISPGGPYRKPQFDVYSVLLLIALVALIVAAVLLVLELGAYEWQIAAVRHLWPGAEGSAAGYWTC